MYPLHALYSRDQAAPAGPAKVVINRLCVEDPRYEIHTVDGPAAWLKSPKPFHRVDEHCIPAFASSVMCGLLPWDPQSEFLAAEDLAAWLEITRLPRCMS